MQNYRVTFGGEKIDYHNNFADCRNYYGMIEYIIHLLNALEIKLEQLLQS